MSLTKLTILAVPVLVFGALLGGCDGEDHSKPDLNDVKRAVQALYGECPLWTLSNVQRIDGAPHPYGYEISYSFVLTLKDPDVLTGHDTNVTKGDARHITLASMDDASDPCFSGARPLAVLAIGEQKPLARSYQGRGDRAFVHSEQGWHLGASPINLRDPESYDQFAPVNDATVAAQTGPDDTESGTAAGNDGSEGQASIFHRLNLLVMSLFRRSPDSGESVSTASPAKTGTTSPGSEPDTTASDAGQVVSITAPTDTASAPAPAVASETSAEPAAVAPVSTAAPLPPTTAPPAVPPLPVAVPTVAPAVGSGMRSPARGNAQANASTADQEVPAPQPAAPAVESPEVPPPAAHPLTEADLEGDWRGIYQCGSDIGSGSVSDPDAWTRHVTMTVRNGQVTLVRQSEGERAFREVLSGSVLPDLSLHLGGTGQRVGAKHPWSADFMGRFDGTADAATFEASGTLSDWHRQAFRACRLALSR